MHTAPGVYGVPVLPTGITDQTSASLTTRTAASRWYQNTTGKAAVFRDIIKCEDIAEQQKNDATLSKLREYVEQRNVRFHKGIKTNYLTSGWGEAVVRRSSWMPPTSSS